MLRNVPVLEATRQETMLLDLKFLLLLECSYRLLKFTSTTSYAHEKYIKLASLCAPSLGTSTKTIDRLLRTVYTCSLIHSANEKYDNLCTINWEAAASSADFYMFRYMDTWLHSLCGRMHWLVFPPFPWFPGHGNNFHS